MDQDSLTVCNTYQGDKYQEEYNKQKNHFFMNLNFNIYVKIIGLFLYRSNN